MRRAFTCSVAVIALLLVAVACRSGGDLSKPETQREFGVRMAKMNLWREAMFRFQREVQISPDNALAHSNLAVALEANGDFDGAAKEYREALRLDRSNQYIQKNYSRFMEFVTKSKKREAAAVKTTDAVDRTPAVTGSTTKITPEKPPLPPPGVPPAPPAEPVPPPTTTTTTTTNPPTGGSR